MTHLIRHVGHHYDVISPCSLEVSFMLLRLDQVLHWLKCYIFLFVKFGVSHDGYEHFKQVWVNAVQVYRFSCVISESSTCFLDDSSWVDMLLHQLKQEITYLRVVWDDFIIVNVISEYQSKDLASISNNLFFLKFF